jgi:predicted NUDIX family NTP pyrophosphohydrolase
MQARPRTVQSAGVLLYRDRGADRQVLLIRPGGPFWRGKDIGAWQIPKGGLEAGESSEAAARREAEEELGVPLTCPLVPLATIRQAGGKRVEAFAGAQDIDATMVRSNSFSLEWPPRSGQFRNFPEVEEARWFDLASARTAMLPSQVPLLDALLALQSGEPIPT